MASLLADPEPGAHVTPRTGVGTNIETSLMAKILAGLFAAGGTLVLLTVALPHAQRASELGALLIVGNAFLAAGALFWRARSVPTGALPLAVAWGSTLITGVAYFAPVLGFVGWLLVTQWREKRRGD